MKTKISLAMGLVLAGVAAAPAFAQSYGTAVNHYEVTVTNLTRGQVFAPILVGTHRPGAHMFTLGQPASAELSALAEGGNPSALSAAFGSNAKVSAVAASSGPVFPGASVTIHITAADGANRLSLAGMLANTNDAFVGLDSVVLPMGRKVMFTAPAYDAGSEPNDELCANIPGPACGGEGTSAGVGGEGYVHVHGGIHGVGGLSPMEYDWRNPVAQIVVRRMP